MFEIEDLRQDEFLLCLRNEANTFNENARARHLLLEAATRLERETSRGDAIERQAETFAAHLRDARELLEKLHRQLRSARAVALNDADVALQFLEDKANCITTALGERQARLLSEIPF